MASAGLGRGHAATQSALVALFYFRGTPVGWIQPSL